MALARFRRRRLAGWQSERGFRRGRRQILQIGLPVGRPQGLRRESRV